jgi:Domain of unknown function (DUF3806)
MSGHADPPPGYPSTDPQQISTPNDEEQQRLDRQRAVVEALLADDAESRRKFTTAAGKLGTIRAVLAAKLFRADPSYELQCLGVVLGDAMVLALGLEWVIVADEQGRDPALRVPATSILLFPLTMISKRVERGEAVDVFDLFNGVAAMVAERTRAGS